MYIKSIYHFISIIESVFNFLYKIVLIIITFLFLILIYQTQDLNKLFQN